MPANAFQFFRPFGESQPDGIIFQGLDPLGGLKSWSAIALIHPVETVNYAGIISQRTNFKIGENQFTFWLKNGALSVEADERSSLSKLVPPNNKWSYVGVTVTPEEINMYLSTDQVLTVEKRPGLPLGSHGGAPLVIGKLGKAFPGSLSFVCLYSGAIDDGLMRRLMSDSLHPLDHKVGVDLVFAWGAGLKDDQDLVSTKSPIAIEVDLIRLPAGICESHAAESPPGREPSSVLPMPLPMQLPSRLAPQQPSPWAPNKGIADEPGGLWRRIMLKLGLISS